VTFEANSTARNFPQIDFKVTMQLYGKSQGIVLKSRTIKE
jgi:hypothetical protein